MVKKLFSRFLGTITVVCLGLTALKAQPTLLNTNFSSNGGGVIPNAATPTFVTFTVTNNNSCPITINEVNWYHIGSIGIVGGGTHSMNGARYSLWRSATSLAGAPNIVTTNNWFFEGSGDTINNGISAGSIIPVIKGLNITVPPNTTYRFALSSTDTMSFFITVNPFTFTSGGVVLSTTPAVCYAGSMPGPGNNVWNGSNPAFCGGILFSPAGEAPPAPPTFTTATLKPCLNSTPVLTATVPAYITNPIYIFRNNKGAIVYQGSSNTYTINGVTTDSSGTWTVTVNNPSCGSGYSLPASVKLDVQVPPAPQIDGKTDYCLNEPFLPVTVLGTFPKWYYSSTGGSPIPFTPPFNTTYVNQDSFFVSQTVNGCESPRTKVLYRATSKPAPPIVTSPQYYCENSPANQLTAAGSQLKWYYQATGGLPSLIAPTPNTTAKDSFNYYVSQSNRGCESNRSWIKVVVTFRPNGLILSTKDKLCQLDTLTLNYYGSAFPGSAYNWTFPVGTTILANDPNFAGPISIKLDSAGMRDIKLQVGADGCYSDLYIKPIRVDTLPTADIALRPNICLGQTEVVSLGSYTLSSDSFFWDWDGGVTSFFSTDQGPYGVTWNTAGDKTVKLRLVNKLCSNTIPVKTTVQPKPDASFKVEEWEATKEFCSSDSLRMTANTIVASSKYSWTPTRFFDNFSDRASVHGRVDFTSQIKLRVEDEYGCFNTDSIKVMTKACCNVTFPSAFTPNGDGKNDIFRMVQSYMQAKTGKQRQIDLRSLRVVNRYGQVVFETVNELTGWDGTLNGKPQDMGTYTYYISYRCDGQILEEKGDVTLIR